LIINYKHHKCILSGQPEYTITFRDKQIHETQIIRDQLNNTGPNSFVVGTGASFSCTSLVSTTSYCNEVFKNTLESSNLAAKFLLYASVINKTAYGVLHDAVYRLLF
jgi:hypothetical protein